VDRQLVIIRSSELGQKVRTLIAFYQRMLKGEITSTHDVFDVLDKNNIDMKMI